MTRHPKQVLVVGRGGREHALAWCLAQSVGASGTAPTVWAYPGSDGMADVAARWTVEDETQVFDAARAAGMDLVVIGPEQMLADDWADRFRAAGVPAWGAGAESVRLETSKQFAKDFMLRHGIPTGRAVLARTADAVRQAVTALPVVLKFDGLAAGKGVAICQSEAEVEAFLEAVFVEGRFGEGPVLVEEYLEGPEVSVMVAVSDGAYCCFPPARDYKRRNDGDDGPNTGGMGAVASRQLLDDAVWRTIEETVIQPTLRGLVEDGLPYRGFLYFGLMLTARGPMMLEYNCRFGDPEAQAILPLVEGDVAGFLADAAAGQLQPDRIAFADGWSVSVVQAAGAYPLGGSVGDKITGLDAVREAQVFHAGTRLGEDGCYETDGGRVLAVSARGATRAEALERVYAGVEQVRFAGAHWRRDIGRLHFDAAMRKGGADD
jgi:phosphoribosylamine---glycine ligase